MSIFANNALAKKEKKDMALPAAVLHCVLIILSFSFFLILDGIAVGEVDTIKILAVWFVVISSISVAAWVKATGSLFTPYTVLVFVMLVFFAGQCYGWAFGIDMGGKDLLVHVVNNTVGSVPRPSIIGAEKYTCVGFLIFQLGALLAKTKTRSGGGSGSCVKEVASSVVDKAAFKNLGRWLAVLSAPAYIVYTYLLLRSVASGGYMEYYTFERTMSQALRLALFPSNWFEPALLIVYATYKDNVFVRRMAACILAMTIGVGLYVGGRSSAVILLLAFLLVRHYYVKRFTVKDLFKLGVGGYALVVLLNVVNMVRLNSSRTIIDYVVAIPDVLQTSIGDILGELGWSMSSLAWTMTFVPDVSGYRYGITYLYATLGVVPNLGFWDSHPVLIANLADWLQSMLNASYGVGYTMIAETFANFGWFGLGVMFIIGFCCSKMLSFEVESVDYRYKYTLIVMIAVSVLLKAFVRSSFSAIFRQLVFVVIVIAIMQLLVKHMMKRKKQDSGGL